MALVTWGTTTVWNRTRQVETGRHCAASAKTQAKCVYCD